MNKFHARKVWVDGRQFDSKVEADRYLVLKDKQRRGEITVLNVRESSP